MKGKQIKAGKGISEKPNKASWKKKRTWVYHTYWLNGLLLSRKPNDERVTHFRGKKLVVPSQQLIPMLGQPKCSLCCEQEFTSTLNYVGCEICEDWFHGDALGLSMENVGNLIGFRCHKCRDRTPPICPHLLRKTSDDAQLGDLNNRAGIECAVEETNIIAVPTGMLEEDKLHTDEESKNLPSDDESTHKDQEPVPDFNKLNEENGYLPISEEQKREAIQIPSEEWRPDLSTESNQHVSLAENTTVLGTGHIGAVTTCVKTEFSLSKSDGDVIDTEMVASEDWRPDLSTESKEHVSLAEITTVLDTGHIAAVTTCVETEFPLSKSNGDVIDTEMVPSENWRPDLSTESNEHVSLAGNSTVLVTGHIGAVTACVKTEFPLSKSDGDDIDTEMASLEHDNVENDLVKPTILGSPVHKTVVDSSELLPQAIVASSEIVDGGEKMV